MSDLLKAAADSPLLLTFLVVLGGAVWAAEKLGGVGGPLTRLFRAWQERELRKLRREQAERRARRDLDDARVADLESEVEWLREQLVDARSGQFPDRAVHPLPRPRHSEPATEPIPGARNSARPRVPGS